MMDVSFNPVALGISANASVVYYPTDRYGSALLGEPRLPLSATAVVTLHLLNNTFTTKNKDGLVMLKEAFYTIESTLGKEVSKIRLHLFDGEGSQPLSKLLSPIPFDALYTYLFYREINGVLVPYLLEDFIEKLDAWLMDLDKKENKTGYQKAIEVLAWYAEHKTEADNSINVPFAQVIDSYLSAL